MAAAISCVPADCDPSVSPRFNGSGQALSASVVNHEEWGVIKGVKMPTKTTNFIARSSTIIAASGDKVWNALVSPAAIKQYMFGTTVTSDWKVGSPITWKGEWQGKAYEDKGVIRQFQPGRALQYTHFSPLAGLPDKPENYHTVTIQLSPEGDRTVVSLTQDNNPTEETRAHSEKNWAIMLENLRKLVEG
jgi:uncharacterized protein YndB with AHSA1/START domain